MREREIKKQELIRNGTFERYKAIKKAFYDDNFEPTKNPNDYNVTDEELQLLIALDKSTKRKKATHREHARFMREYYGNVGFLTLTFSGKALMNSTFEYKRHKVTDILPTAFDDYFGKFEISPNGRLHFHGIVAWNENYESFKGRTQKDGKWVTRTMIKVPSLTDCWYGEKDEKGQPTKYGIYELLPIEKSEDDNKTSNYVFKHLNTVESYILKTEEFDPDVTIDEELLFKVNTSYVIVARNTPFKAWRKARDEQDKEIKHTARVFETSFYDKNKYNSPQIFRDWAENNRHTNISMRKDYHIDLFGDDFELVKVDDFKDFSP